jgi:probable rRNA maturation factor
VGAASAATRGKGNVGAALAATRGKGNVGAALAATRGRRFSIVVRKAARGKNVPKNPTIRKWTAAALHGAVGEVTVRIVTIAESAELNARYRGDNRATNVLSFPAGTVGALSDRELAPLGDLVVCAEVVAREAREQQKTLEAHWAHMLIHGALHLIGYDHMTESQARRMESRERKLLAALGFHDPYSPMPRAGSARRVACKGRSRPAR